MVLAAQQGLFAAAIRAAQQEPFALMVIAYRTVLSTAAMAIPARQEIIAVLVIAARTVKPAAAMVAARQDGFAVLTSWDAVLWGQPVQKMDTANKKPAPEGPVLDS